MVERGSCQDVAGYSLLPSRVLVPCVRHNLPHSFSLHLTRRIYFAHRYDFICFCVVVTVLYIYLTFT